MGYTRSLDKNQQTDGAYYPAVHTVVEGESDEDSNSSSSEEDKPKQRQRLSYRRRHDEHQKRRGPQTRSMSRQVVEPEDQEPRRVYDYGMYDRTEQRRRQAESANRLQLRGGEYVQYGNTVYPRYRNQATTPAPTKLPPRLLLKSGDNVHFGEGINWSIYRTDSGLTRVGTRDGEVVVRVVRPEYGRPTTTEAPETTTQAVRATTPYQWNWQPCYTEQECYRQYVNEYYRFYAHNQ